VKPDCDERLGRVRDAGSRKRLVELLLPGLFAAELVAGGCQRVSQPKRSMENRENRMATEAKNPSETTPLTMDLRREGDDLLWKVQNASDQPVWAFLLIPMLKNGAMSFSEDAAWLEAGPDDTLLVRKVDTPIPNDVDADNRLRSGAVLLKPGGSLSGRLRLGAAVKLRVPYRSSQNRVVTVSRVLFEVGWLPYHAETAPKLLTAEGHEFAYVFSEREPGGQRLARSAPLSW